MRAPGGWSDVTELEPRFVVFGELHGTRQGPEFIGNLACALASRGERILLAVEHSSTNDAALQAAWSLPADRFGQALVETGWAGRQDGVASQAMFAMLVRARYPNATEGTIRGWIQEASFNPACGWNCYTNAYGFGVVNAYWAAF